MIKAPTQPLSGVDDRQRVDNELWDVNEGQQVEIYVIDKERQVNDEIRAIDKWCWVDDELWVTMRDDELKMYALMRNDRLMTNFELSMQDNESTMNSKLSTRDFELTTSSSYRQAMLSRWRVPSTRNDEIMMNSGYRWGTTCQRNVLSTRDVELTMCVIDNGWRGLLRDDNEWQCHWRWIPISNMWE